MIKKVYICVLISIVCFALASCSFKHMESNESSNNYAGYADDSDAL